MAVRAMKAGAVDFMTNPFREQDLLHAVAAAIAKDGVRRAKELSNSILRERFDSLSSRERDVVARVAAGAFNKQIAAELGISEVTVKVYRASVMRKLRAKSVAELVRIAVQAEPLSAFPNEVSKTESCGLPNSPYPDLAISRSDLSNSARARGGEQATWHIRRAHTPEFKGARVNHPSG